jgi:hypothetical protein
MTTSDQERQRKEEFSRIHDEIWEARISQGMSRANQLLDTKIPTPPEYLLHFTSASALASILPNRTLRLSRARASNDPNELSYALGRALKEQEKVSKDQVDKIFQEELLASFEGRPLDGSEHRTMDPHICCFTEAGSADLVAHWAMYGRDGSGFVLKFKAATIGDKKNLGLAKVNYDEEQQRAHLREVLAIGRETSCMQIKNTEGGGGSARFGSRRMPSGALSRCTRRP